MTAHYEHFLGGAGPTRRCPSPKLGRLKPFHNYWWYGFGIWWIPRGTVWTVWGFDAVGVGLNSGRRFRIGTDEPEALLTALERRLMAG